jgi:integrase
MPTNVLTDLKVRSAKPTARLVKLSDGGGLQLWLMPTGAKYWRLAYRLGGKQKLLALGVYPAMTLSEAREARDAARKIIKAGNDPVTVKRTERTAKAIATANTFGVLAAQLLEKRTREGKAPRTLEKMRYLIGLALPSLGQRPISEISRAEVLAVLKLVDARGKYETARKLRAAITSVFRYAIALEPEINDPTVSLYNKDVLTPRPVIHRPAIIKPQPFGALLRAIDGYSGQRETRLALQLLALVFVRPGELQAAEWSEINWDAREWVIPPEKTKQRRELRVPLSTQALDILQQLHAMRRGQYIFPSERSSDRPLSENTLNSALRRLGYSSDEMCAHGFRSSASSMLNECKLWHPDAIERQLAHTDRDATRKAYARADYWAERVEMMQWWSDRCDQMRHDVRATQAA